MTKVFISYSRKDKVFAGRLTEALQKSELETWIDWEDIPPVADWLEQIHKGIEEADAFLFLLSPASVASKVCGQEVDHAVQNGKRLIPIVARDVIPNDVHPALAKVNWIYCRENDDFDGAVSKTLSAIRTDLAWVETHKRLQVRAIEWDKRKDRSLLLRGKDLREAEERLASAGQKDPQPTDLQRQYVLSSRNGETRTRNMVLVISVIVMVALAVSSVFAVSQRNTAKDNALTAVANEHVAQTAQANEDEQAKISHSGELNAQAILAKNMNLDLSLLLSVESFLTKPTLRSKSVLLDETQTNPHLVQYLYGHSGPINALAFSPDGKVLASGGDDHSVILWDYSAGRPIGKPLSRHTDTVTAVAFSPDGRILISGSKDGSIIFWNVENWQIITQLFLQPTYLGNTDSVNCIAISPDGKTLAVGGIESLTIWNVETGRQIGEQLDRKYYGTTSMAFSKDGTILAEGEGESGITLWDLGTRQPIEKSIEGHYSTSVENIFFSKNEKVLISGGAGSFLLWNLETGEGALGYINPVIIGKAALSPDGRIIAFGSCNSPDGTASACIQGTVYLWDQEKHQLINEPFMGHNGWVAAVAFTPDGKYLASGGTDGAIIIWSMERQQPVGYIATGEDTLSQSMALSPDGKIIAYGADNIVHFWDVEKSNSVGKPLIGLGESSNIVMSLAFSPKEKMLATGYFDGTILLWNTETYQLIGQPLKGHTNQVDSLAFGPGGNVLASSSLDKTIILWDTHTYQPIGQPLVEYTEWVTSLVFNSDGNILASADSYDGTVILWNVKTQPPIAQPLLPAKGTRIVFSNDGKILLIANGENFELWDVETHKLIGQPINGNVSIWSIAFSPDGQMLASGHDDGTIRLWDKETHQPIGQALTGHTSYVHSLFFTSNGKLLISGSLNSGIRLWNTDPQAWVSMACQRAGRNFTYNEWLQYFPNEKYRATCPQWSLEPEIITTPAP